MGRLHSNYGEYVSVGKKRNRLRQGQTTVGHDEKTD